MIQIGVLNSDKENILNKDSSTDKLMNDTEVQSWSCTSHVLKHNLSYDARKDCLLQIFANRDIKCDSLTTNNQTQEQYESFHYCSTCNKVFPSDKDVYICTEELF